ncbi:hypothetical protein B0H11DRAFT_1148022 [Mycena galericulata]|nr:hypothetical protein B0H11DRAFT_1148022 [Mycena galericulata]
MLVQDAVLDLLTAIYPKKTGQRWCFNSDCISRHTHIPAGSAAVAMYSPKPYPFSTAPAPPPLRRHTHDLISTAAKMNPYYTLSVAHGQLRCQGVMRHDYLLLGWDGGSVGERVRYEAWATTEGSRATYSVTRVVHQSGMTSSTAKDVGGTGMVGAPRRGFCFRRWRIAWRPTAGGWPLSAGAGKLMRLVSLAQPRKQMKGGCRGEGGYTATRYGSVYDMSIPASRAPIDIRFLKNTRESNTPRVYHCFRVEYLGVSASTLFWVKPPQLDSSPPSTPSLRASWTLHPCTHHEYENPPQRAPASARRCLPASDRGARLS